MTAAVKNETVEIVKVIYVVWQAIQRRHPDVPDVAITLAAGADGKKLKYGHFHANSWVRGKEMEMVHELFIGGEGLSRGAAELLGTLLHEAAHGVATTRKIQDTSRQGRFHNTKFKAIGEELGLELAQTGSIGWSDTSVPDATRTAYAREIKRLQAVLGIYRRITPRATKERNGGTKLTLKCECGRGFQISPSVAEQGPIWCHVCDTEFEEKEA